MIRRYNIPLLVAIVLSVAAMVLAPPAKSLLVGYGCDGTNGPIYAKEESDFPKCHEISR